MRTQMMDFKLGPRAKHRAIQKGNILVCLYICANYVIQQASLINKLWAAWKKLQVAAKLMFSINPGYPTFERITWLRQVFWARWIGLLLMNCRHFFLLLLFRSLVYCQRCNLLVFLCLVACLRIQSIYQTKLLCRGKIHSTRLWIDTSHGDFHSGNSSAAFKRC